MERVEYVSHSGNAYWWTFGILNYYHHLDDIYNKETMESWEDWWEGVVDLISGLVGGKSGGRPGVS